jgi:4-diphosphocytidyl-2-C-methyl-D-erythritol kinase
LQVSAFAKINLTFEVLGRRSDGCHEVMTILQTIDLADRLDLLPARTLRVECDAPGLNGESNLVWQAATKLAQLGGIRPGARVIIRKRIPIGMGLGGGSSDAATALVALNQMWELALPPAQLSEVAAELGSDVPFFLQGGTALAQGRGEQVSSLPSLPKLTGVLVCPETTIPRKTAKMYSSLTSAHYSDGGVTRRMVETLTGGQFVVDMMHNAFEAVAFQVFQGLGETFRQMSLGVPSRPHLSGAGPALFCLPFREEEYQRLVTTLHPLGVRAYLVHTVSARDN